MFDGSAFVQRKVNQEDLEYSGPQLHHEGHV